MINENFDVPVSLRSHRAWFLWDRVQIGTEAGSFLQRRPCSANTEEYIDPSSFRDLSEFIDAFERLTQDAVFDCLGLLVPDNIVGLELPGALDDKGTVLDWAREFCERSPTYWERDHGLNVCRGFFRLRTPPPELPPEVIVAGRSVRILKPQTLCAVTGDHVASTPDDVMECPEGAEWSRELIGNMNDRIDTPEQPTLETALLANVPRPEISMTDQDLHVAVSNAVDALLTANSRPRIFSHDGALVRVATLKKGHVVLRPLSQSSLKLFLSASARFTREFAGHTVLCKPDEDIARAILSLTGHELGFPEVVSIATAPVFRPDGTLLQEKGYDESTKLFYAPGLDIESLFVPLTPTSEDLRQARKFIRSTFEDFPFADDASLANYIAGLITPAIRRLVGNAPMLIVIAPQVGTGKTLLCIILALIYLGFQPPMESAPGPDSEEWEKKLFALLLTGPSIVVFDNAVTIQSASLAKALTATEIQGRVLGHSEIRSVSHNAFFIANGNNVTLGHDLARRCFQVHLNARTSRPYLRTGFHHDPLEQWVQENRPQLLTAILTLIRSWFAAGRPPAHTPVIGSFEPWCRIVGGILQHAGISGFLQNFDDAYAQADLTDQQWEMFLRTLRVITRQPFTSAELLGLIEQQPVLFQNAPTELADVLRRRNAQSLGMVLSKVRDRRFGDAGIYISRRGENRNGSVTWIVAADDNSDQ